MLTIIPAGSTTAASTVSCVWESVSTIRCEGTTTFFAESSERVQSLKMDNLGNSDYDFIAESVVKIYESGGTPTSPAWAYINPLNPLEGTAGGVNGPRDLTLSDPWGKAPKPLEVITKGYIIGKVIPSDKVNANNLPLLIGGNVELFGPYGKIEFENTKLPSVGGNNSKEIFKDGNYYAYNGIDIGKIVFSSTNNLPTNKWNDGREITGLPTGKYSLKFTRSEGSDCATGDMKTETLKAALSQTQCSTTLQGDVEFDLIYQAGGFGKINIISSDSAELKSPLNGKLLPTTANNQNGINIFVEQTRTSPLDAALSSAVRTVADFVQTTTKFVMNAINDLLLKTADYVVGKEGDPDPTRGVLGPWTAMRNIGLSLLVMALIIIAFANVLQIDIEQYGLGRMIPKIIISIFMAMASWIIVVFFFDFTQALQQQAIGLVGGSNGLTSMGSMSIDVPTTGDIIGKVGAILLLLAIFVAVLICGVVLFFTLILRVVMLSLLLAVAPLAFILNVVPFTSNLYKMWWTEFWKWMFMGPVALLIIALGSIIASSISGGQTVNGMSNLDASTITSSDQGIRMLIGLIAFAGSLYVAATLPLKWGGNIMKSWSKFGKGLGGKLGGDYLKKGWDARGKQVAARKDLSFQRTFGRLAGSGRLGQTLTGTNSLRAAAMANEVQQSYVKELATSGDLNAMKKYAGSSNPMMQKAAALAAQEAFGGVDPLFAKEGELDSHGQWTQNALDTGADKRAEKQGANFVYGHLSDNNFRSTMIDKAQGTVTRAALEHSTSNPQEANNLLAAIDRKNTGKAAHEMDGGYIGALADYSKAGDTLAQEKAAAIMNGLKPSDSKNLEEKGGKKIQKKFADLSAATGIPMPGASDTRSTETPRDDRTQDPEMARRLAEQENRNR